MIVLYTVSKLGYPTITKIYDLGIVWQGGGLKGCPIPTWALATIMVLNAVSGQPPSAFADKPDSKFVSAFPDLPKTSQFMWVCNVAMVKNLSGYETMISKGGGHWAVKCCGHEGHFVDGVYWTCPECNHLYMHPDQQKKLIGEFFGAKEAAC